MDYDLQIRRGRQCLLVMQIFSTLGFSVLYSSLVLYMTGGLNLSSQYALSITGGFIAFNYTLHVLGGYIGGRFLSYRALFIIGMFLQVIGSLLISIAKVQLLLMGIAVFLSGCGLNVICINCMLTQLFDAHDKRRESAFLWNYSGMNLGYFIGFTVSGIFQLQEQFHALFIFAASGSVIAFLLALWSWKYLADKNTLYLQSRHRHRRIVLALCLIAALIAALYFFLIHVDVINVLIILSGIFVALLFMGFAIRAPRPIVSNKIWSFLILGLGGLIFWTLYQMAPMGLTLFYVNNVRHTIQGFTIPPQWMQNINTILIIISGPLIAKVNQSLRSKGFFISIPFQFITALILIGIGFSLLPLGIFFADAQGNSSIGWFIGAYLFQSCGELFISPIGYAMVGQLIPSRLQALAMGAWMMVSGVAAILSNYFSQKALGSSGETDPLLTNPTYAASFLKLSIAALVCGMILFLLKSRLHKLIQEKPSLKSIEPAPYNASQEETF